MKDKRKINKKKFNRRPYVKPDRHLNHDEYKLLWTAVWLVFIAFLCFIFSSGMPLWLFLLWFIGVM